MKIAAIIFLFALMCPLAASSSQLGQPAPSFGLKDLNGRVVTLDEFRGKVIFLTFWATWCRNCTHELRELEAFYNKHRMKGFEIIAISIESAESTVSKFVQQNSLSYTVLLDKKEEAVEEYGCSHLPTAYIIGRDGVIQHIHKGFGKEFLPVYEKEILELLKH